MMQKLLIATTNPAKTREHKELLADLNLETISLADFSNFKPVEKTGVSFKENAILKAKGYFTQFHIPTLADDGGFEIDALGGAPRVRSHRWLGRESSDGELIKYTLKKLKGVPLEKRTARITTWVAFYNGKNLLLERGTIDGYVVKEYPNWIEKGFPWRSILFIPEFGKLYQDLTPEEHEKINHRRKILEKLKPKIKEVLGI